MAKKDNLLDELKKKNEEYLNDLKRSQADFINFKRRVEEERRNWLKFANVGIIQKLLPVLDNFQRASLHVPKELTNSEFIKGVQAIEKQLETVLKEEGVERIESKGGHFDHNFHEAVLFEESDKPEGEILDELESGFRIGETVIKPAKVKVSKGKPLGEIEAIPRQARDEKEKK